MRDSEESGAPEISGGVGRRLRSDASKPETRKTISLESGKTCADLAFEQERRCCPDSAGHSFG